MHLVLNKYLRLPFFRITLVQFIAFQEPSPSFIFNLYYLQVSESPFLVSNIRTTHILHLHPLDLGTICLSEVHFLISHIFQIPALSHIIPLLFPCTDISIIL